MYKFKDYCDETYLLTEDEDPINPIICCSQIDSGVGCTLTREQASGFAARLQFFADHGRLPKEAPPKIFADLKFPFMVDGKVYGEFTTEVETNPEKKVYIVSGSNEDSCGTKYPFVVGVFDCEDKAKCAMNDYRHDNEGDLDTYDFYIEEFLFNEIDSNER